jgi:hypothetical protein
VKSAAAPNFVHSLDAAHLVKVVNRAVSEDIADILTVHDCYYGLAPQAERLHSIILDELGNLYLQHDPLGELRARNVSDPDVLPVPAKWTLLEWKHGTRTLGHLGAVSRGAPAHDLLSGQIGLGDGRR